jgi:hypothetical protein
MVLFDLDDTLVPTQKQILPAHEAMLKFMEIKMPKTSALLKENMSSFSVS